MTNISPLIMGLGADFTSPVQQMLTSTRPFTPIDVSAYADDIRVDFFDEAHTGQGVNGYGPSWPNYPTAPYWGWSSGDGRTYPTPLLSITSADGGGLVINDAFLGEYYFDLTATQTKQIQSTSWVVGNLRRKLTARFFRADTGHNGWLFDQTIIAVP